MAASHETFAPAWSIRLATDLSANDQTARNLVGGFTDEQLTAELGRAVKSKFIGGSHGNDKSRNSTDEGGADS
jgi:hypothetical protein